MILLIDIGDSLVPDPARLLGGSDASRRLRHPGRLSAAA